MLKKSLWAIALCSVASVGLMLTPSSSDARGPGGRGGGGRGWSGGSWGGRGSYGGWDRGRGWGGFGAGVALGYGLGGWGWGYPYYGGYGYSYPYYGGYYGSTPYYYDYSNPGYTYSSPTSYDQSNFATQQPSMGYYGNFQQQPTNPNAVDLTVFVPDPNAQIWFENHETQQRGTVRAFESTVQPGQTYNFRIRAHFMQNGQPVDVTRDVQAQAGQRVQVNFANAQATNQGAENLQQMPAGNVPRYGNDRNFNSQPGTFNNQQGNRNVDQGNLNHQVPGNTNPAPAPGNTGTTINPNPNTGTTNATQGQAIQGSRGPERR